MMQHPYSLRQILFAEFIGTAMLLAAVIGSGIMAQRLSGGNDGLALLANTLATVFALFVLIEILGPISGAHFNPIVTLIFKKNLPNVSVIWSKLAIFYIVSQLAGAVAGAALAHAMFDLPLRQTSSHVRGSLNAALATAGAGGAGQWLAEAVATAGLVVVIGRSGAAGVHAKASALVACYIGAAYWFTASTSFANPAAVLGRMLSDSFAGIAPQSALGFVAAQGVGAWLGWVCLRLLGLRGAWLRQR
jgi:glycerol uptake facilitator-like aquaporin